MKSQDQKTIHTTATTKQQHVTFLVVNVTIAVVFLWQKLQTWRGKNCQYSWVVVNAKIFFGEIILQRVGLERKEKIASAQVERDVHGLMKNDEKRSTINKTTALLAGKPRHLIGRGNV